MSFGNVLLDTKRALQGKIIGASLIPAKHTYFDQPSHTDLSPLDNLIARLPINQKAMIPKFRRHPLANVFPVLRSHS